MSLHRVRSIFEASLLAGTAAFSGACEGDLGDPAPSVPGPAVTAAPNSTTMPTAPGAGSDGVNVGEPGTMPGNGTSDPGASPTTTGGMPVDGVPATPGGTTEPDPVPGAPSSTAPTVEEPPPPFEPAVGMLRRLTRTQFRNAVQDVFDVEINVDDLDADIWSGDFAVIGANSVVTSALGVEQYQTAIEGAVDQVFADAARQAEFIGCTPGVSVDDACVRGFIETLGRKAWRRPLEAAEVDRLATVAANAATELDSAVEGVRWATVAMFTSPSFIYRAELGAVGADGARRFTGYEMASRLAFLVWNSLPDDALLDEAESGALDTREGVRTAALRMLAEPAGREAVGAFAEEFMRLDRVGDQAKDLSLFPEYNSALQSGMIRDMRDAWEVVAFDEQASALSLFTTTRVFVNAELAELYGVDSAGLSSDTFEERQLPADGPRVGILGKAGFLSQFANQKEGSPTLRGKFMRQALMCTTVPPPPGEVDIVLDEPAPDMPLTKRQRLEEHRVNPNCSLCHSLMDPMGLPFETFDAIGRYRTTERGLTIDPSGDFEGQAVADAREFSSAIGSSESVAQCLVRKYYTYALGFEQRPVDGSVVAELDSSFQASGYQLRELILNIVTHDAFSLVAPQPESDSISP